MQLPFSPAAPAQTPEQAGPGENCGARDYSGWYCWRSLQSRVLFFRQTARWTVRTLLDPHLKHLREVKGMPVCFLPNHFAAAEAVGNDEFIVRRIAHGGQQHALATIQTDLIMVGFVSKRPGHPAAPGVRNVAIEPGFPQEIGFALEVKDRLVMTMPVDQGFAAQCGRLIILHVIV
jgi:hypothetical protein